MMARNRGDAVEAFERELVAFGLVLPRGGAVADGTIHRLDDGQHRQKRNGAAWYVLHETPTGLLIGRAGSWWRNRGGFKWNSRGEAKLRPADRKAIAELQRKVEAERAEHYRQGTERAAVIWAAGKPCSSHPYLTRKGVKSHGLRIADDGRLLVPVRDLDGGLRGVQRIDAKGDKRFTFGTDRQHPTCLVIGNIDEADTVAVVEGYATGATVFQATGWPVVVAFDAGGLDRIAKPLRQRLLKATLVFAGDHDASGTGQKAAGAAARSVGGVVALPPTEGHDWNDHAAEHSLDDVRARLIAAAGNYVLPSTVTLEEGAEKLERIIGGFFAEAQEWNAQPEYIRPFIATPVHGLSATMGAGKSRIARHHAGKLLADQSKAMAFSLPLHRLTNEQAADFKAETGRDAAIWRGMDQPDPERDDGKGMCLEPELSEAARDAGASMSAICKVCPSRNDCGYRRQASTVRQIWFMPHNLLFHPKPQAIPAPAALVIDEKFHDAGMAANIRLAASTLDGDLMDVPHKGDREMLKELRGMLLASLKVAGATAQAPEKRARLTRTHLEAVGLTADMADQARAIEWKRKPKPKLSGNAANMARQLRELGGLFTPKVATLWALVGDLLRSNHDTGTNIEIEADAALQGGDGRGLLVWMHHRLDVHESWRAPTLIMDGTAKPEIIRLWFPELSTHPETHIQAPHQKVTWVRASFSKARLVPTEGAGERRNQARRNNLEDLRRYIEVQAARYRGQAARGLDVLVVVNKAVEELLKAGRLPPNVAVEHYNNLRGSNDYEKVRAVIVVGRTLPDAATIHRQAERIAGHPLTADDALVAATRWSICEAELLQTVGRGRGIRRTEANPLDVLILGDVRLPLKIDTVTGWETAQPTPLELLAARGVQMDCPTTSKGYWAVVAAVLPDVFKDVQAAKDYAKGSRWNLSIGNSSIDVFHRESWLPMTATPLGSRYGVPARIDPEQLVDLRAALDLRPRRPDPKPPRPVATVPRPETVDPATEVPSPPEPVVPLGIHKHGHAARGALTCRATTINDRLYGFRVFTSDWGAISFGVDYVPPWVDRWPLPLPPPSARAVAGLTGVAR